MVGVTPEIRSFSVSKSTIIVLPLLSAHLPSHVHAPGFPMILNLTNGVLGSELPAKPTPKLRPKAKQQTIDKNRNFFISFSFHSTHSTLLKPLTFSFSIPSPPWLNGIFALYKGLYIITHIIQTSEM
jgi:hypothetical protein